MISGLAWMLLLGQADGDAGLAEATRDLLLERCSERDAAARAGLARSTMRRHAARARAMLARCLEDGHVNAEDLVET